MVKNNNKKIEDLDFLDGIPLAVALPEDSTLPDPGRLMYYDGLKIVLCIWKMKSIENI